jgi:hypothetical protein
MLYCTSTAYNSQRKPSKRLPNKNLCLNFNSAHHILGFTILTILYWYHGKRSQGWWEGPCFQLPAYCCPLWPMSTNTVFPSLANVTIQHPCEQSSQTEREYTEGRSVTAWVRRCGRGRSMELPYVASVWMIRRHNQNFMLRNILKCSLSSSLTYPNNPVITVLKPYNSFIFFPLCKMAEENIWTEEGWSDRRLEKTA